MVGATDKYCINNLDRAKTQKSFFYNAGSGKMDQIRNKTDMIRKIKTENATVSLSNKHLFSNRH